MENLKEQYLENTYTILTPLKDKDDCGTYLVKNQLDGSLAVKKKISNLQFPIYCQLQDLPHPNLARVLEVYSIYDNDYILEEYVSGSTISALLKSGYRFKEPQILKIILQLCEVLSFLHSHNIIHRDITPDNILISTDAVVKLIDFGISRTKKAGQSKDTIILGTVGYAAPEQFGFRQTDERTDIYAVGVLLNVLLTGTLPSQKLVSDPHYRRIVEKCICLDPSGRYPCITDLAIQMRRLQPSWSSQPFSSPKPMPPADSPPVSRSMPGRILHSIPGFRTGNPVKMFLAVFGYFVLFLVGYGAAFGPLKSGDTRLELWVVVIFFFYLPWAVYVDAGYYTRKLKFFQDANVWKRFFLKTVMALLSIFVCMVLIYLLSFV